jgi:type VI secretion system protein ImpG
MNDKLLNHFNAEMAYLQQAGAKFATAYPKVAARLKLNAQGTTDPQVGLLLESFALLNARIQTKLDDGFPQLTGTLLDMLYPHYQKPIPAMSITQFQPQPDLVERVVIPAGTLLETNPALGDICRFQTCYDTELLPLAVEAAELSKHLHYVPPVNLGTPAESCLRLVLRCSDAEMTFSKLQPRKLRFYLQGQSQHAFQLYELLFKHISHIGIKDVMDDGLTWLAPTVIKKVGFDKKEGLIPYPARSMLGYRLLTEFFAFPEKFLFFDLLLDESILNAVGNQLEIYLYFNHSNDVLERHISAATFVLGCTPVVNLFPHAAEPIVIDQRQYQYPLIPDNRNPEGTIIYSVDAVTGIDSHGDETHYLPFYGVNNGMDSKSHHAFWSTTCDNDLLSLSLVNSAGENSLTADEVLYVETSCMNSSLPADLAYSHEPFAVQFSTFTAPVCAIRLLLPPTMPKAALTKTQSHYALLAHLASNHISLADAEQSAAAIKNIMKLYNFSEKDESSAMAGCIIAMQSQHVMRYCKFAGINTLCQGLALKLVLDDTHFVGNSAYLFAEVIENFLALYCSVNGFIELTVTSKDNAREIYRGKPRSGEKNLL